MIQVIQSENQQKIRIAKYGANKLFGVDFSIRQQMNDPQLIELFDQIWSIKLKKLISQSEACSLEEVYRRLENNSSSQKYFISSNCEHRSFSYEYADFIIQLELNKDSQYQLTHIWIVKSSDTNPKALFIEFDSVDEKEFFKSLAKNISMKDSDLGLQLLRNFMTLHPDYDIIKKNNT